MPEHPDLSSELFWSIIDRLPIAIYMKDVDCKFTYINNYGAQKHGLENPDEVIGKTDADFFDTSQAKIWIADEKKIMTSMEDMIDHKELELWTDGRRRWVLTSKFPLFSFNGTVLGLFGMTRDITELERVNLAVANAREGLWYRAVKSNEVWYSPHWKEILGYTDDELPNQREKFKELVHPDDWSLVKEKCDEHLYHNAKYYECTFRMRHKDKRYRWIRSRGMATRNEKGEPIVFAGSHTDITNSRDYESFYLKVLDTSPNLIFVKDKNLRFVFVNKAIAKIFDKRKDEIIGKKDEDLNPDKEQVKRFVEADKYVMANNKPIDIPEETLTDSQGNKLTLKTKKMPLVYPGKTGPHVLGVATDITDLKSVREDLRKTLSVLSEAVKDIENSESEEVACGLTMLYLERLGYESVMLSFLREHDGIREIIADEKYTIGKYEKASRKTIQPIDVPKTNRDLLASVLAEKKPRFILDSTSDDEIDKDYNKECGIVSQYVIPIATDSLMIGTLQIDLGKLEVKPEIPCKMFDALVAHLSIVIERHRVLQRLEAVNTDLTNQARIIGFETAASVILHDLNHSIADYAKLLQTAMKNPEIRKNKGALDFLKSTRKRISYWIDSVKSNVDKVRKNEEYGEYKVDEIVKEAVSTWQHKANAQNRKLKGIYQAGDSVVRIRAGSLKDLLSCLIVNSTESNARHIEVSTQHVSKRNTLEGKNDMVELVVSDDGDGVPEEFKKNIYEFGWSSKTEYGHGMGLTVVDLLAKSMGGKVILRSCGKSSGEAKTEFVVYIPIL